MDSKTDSAEYTRETIFTLLKRKGSTQSDLAAYLGVSRFVVSQWRRGISNSFTSTEYISKIASFFGVTINYLVGKKEDSDEELNDYLTELKNRPEMRQLFKASKSATKEDVERAVNIIEALKKQSGGSDDE